MHPIIKEYISSSESMEVIYKKYHDKNQFLECVHLKLALATNNEEVDPQLFIEIDQAIISGHPDTNVYMLFISFALAFTSLRRQLERSNVIRSIGLSLRKDDLQPLIISRFLLSLALLKAIEGKWSESNELTKDSLSKIDRDHPRYKIGILINAATLYSNDGRLEDFEKADLDLLDVYETDQIAFVCIHNKLSNLIFTGNFKKGKILLEEYKRVFKGNATYIIEGKNNLLKLLTSDFNSDNYKDEQFKLFAKVCNYLLLNNIYEANKTYKLLESDIWEKSITIPFKKYMPLHFELCLRNKGKAKLLYDELQKKMGEHYLDDFFLARIYLLENNIEAALQSFNRLIKNIKHYDALNRLVFELQFANEMKATDVLILMNGIHCFDLNNKSEAIKENLPHQKKDTKGNKLLIGESAAIQEVKKIVKKFAGLKEPVLITGETGTGKELVARAIHEEGRFPKAPFLAINCGALTESLLQSELFGYVAGAFTGAQREQKGIFEAAGKGTVFLDEFGDISPKMQVSLLRVLESNEIRLIGGTTTRQIECKIVIATNTDLQLAVNEKKFREDLYFRLLRFDIKLPPLRDRIGDIPKLIESFLNNNNDSTNRKKVLSKKLEEALLTYRWPGNIRELKNEIERLKVLHSDKEFLDLDDFDFTHLKSDMPVILKEKSIDLDIPTNIPKPKLKDLQIDDDHIKKIMQRGSKLEIKYKFLKDLFQKYKKMTRIQIIEITSLSQATVSKDLKKLCALNFIEKIKPTKSVKSHYFVLKE